MFFNTIKHHCVNCGKMGHLNRMCKEPVTSFGVVCVRLEDSPSFISAAEAHPSLSLSDYNACHNRCLSSCYKYKDKIRFLLIRRRHSLGILEFVRGRYEVQDYKGITKLFKLMSSSEIEMIRDAPSFDHIWNTVWSSSPQKSSSLHAQEFQASMEKFEILRSGFREKNVLGLSYYTTHVAPEWGSPEWGFPKGRRAHHEKSLECALREFEEETGYLLEDHHVVKSVVPMKELFRGTNNIPYKHVYYLSVLTNAEKEPCVEDSNKEIGEAGWFTYSEAVRMFRPYHVEKKRLLNDVFKFVVSILDKKN